MSERSFYHINPESQKAIVLAEFYSRLDGSTFRNTKSLRKVAEYCVSGEFAQGLVWFKGFLERRNIEIIELTKEEKRARRQSGLEFTEWDNDNHQGKIFVGLGFGERTPLNQLINLTHQYKSILLRRDGLRDEDKHVASLLETDLALLRVVEFGGGDTRTIATFRDEYRKRLEGARKRMQK